MSIRLTRAGDGCYTTQDGRYSVQQPHGLDPQDPDRQWYVLDQTTGGVEFGPFDTLKEVREHLQEHLHQPKGSD